MPARRSSTSTQRDDTPRLVGKKSTPMGPDGALVLSAASEQALALSYWDLWFALVADADFDGSWDRFVAHLQWQKKQGGASRLAERKLSHLRDLQLWRRSISCPSSYDGLATRSSRENRANMNGPMPCGIHPDNATTPTRCAGFGHSFLFHLPPMPNDLPHSSQRAAGFLRTSRLGWRGSWTRSWMTWPA